MLARELAVFRHAVLLLLQIATQPPAGSQLDVKRPGIALPSGLGLVLRDGAEVIPAEAACVKVLLAFMPV